MKTKWIIIYQEIFEPPQYTSFEGTKEELIEELKKKFSDDELDDFISLQPLDEWYSDLMKLLNVPRNYP